MSTSEITALEMVESLTGYEEIAVERAFGRTVATLTQDKALRLTMARMLVFAHYRRDGMKDPAAKEAALQLTIKEVNEFFVPDVDDDGNELLDEESGKDSTSPAAAREISPPGASQPAKAPERTAS